MSKASRTVRVLLVDDHQIVRAGFRSLLSVDPEFQVVGEASSAEEAVKLYAELKPDVVGMDISLPGISGIAATAEIIASDPKAQILMYSIHEEPVIVEQALQAGALGYVTKSGAAELLPMALRTVATGEAFLDAKLAQTLLLQRMRGKLPALASLTAREFEVFRLLAEGKDMRAIGTQLGLSYKTIANYAVQVREKLNVRSAAELVRLAYDYNIVQRLPLSPESIER